jgi:PadR family transcriptional regulator, regulatory protein PadR
VKGRRMAEDPGDEPDLAFGRAGRCCEGRGRARAGVGRGALVEPAALAALLRGDAHGYDLRRSIAELTEGQIEVDVGGLYRVLRRLEAEGFLVSQVTEGGGGPPRREYQLTTEGRELAEDWVGHLRERRRLATLLEEALEKALGRS